MRMTLESTDQIVDVDGTQCRVWQGLTGDGLHVVAFVKRIACRAGDDTRQLDRELKARTAPTSGPVHQAVSRILG